MKPLELHDRLGRLDRGLGDESRVLRLGDFAIAIEGLDRGLAGQLDDRWGGFVSRRSGPPTACVLRVFQAGDATWLDFPNEIEAYRIEALNDPARRLVASYHFALAEERAPDRWRIGLTDQDREPLQRCLDNALRFLTARLAVSRGGFAMHSAGVVRDERAFLFAGPSRAGKTTAVGLAARPSLGDDFGLVIPRGEEWLAPALPFDNSERVLDRPAEGLFPVAGIWRLYQAGATRVENPPRQVAVASLMGCTAFPWTMPERAPDLLEHVERFVAAGLFHHLRFSRDQNLWDHLR